MDAFISYRRKPSASLAMLIQEKLSNKHKLDVYVDTTRTDSTKVQFPERLMQAIGEAPVFVCLLGDETLDSEWVLKEIEEAYRLKKRCIPVFQESYKAANNPPPAVNYLLSFDGVHVLDMKNIHIDYSVQELAALIKPKRPRNNLPIGIGIGIIVLSIVLGFIFIPNIMRDMQNQALTQAALSRSDDIEAASTEIQIASVSHTPYEVPSDTATDRPTETTRPSLEPRPTDTTPPTLEPSATDTATDEPTLTPTLDPLQTALNLANAGVTNNAQWETAYPNGFEWQDDSGIEMLLVPSGSFQMGNDPSAFNVSYDNSSGVPDGGRVTVNSFWIDKTEVSQADYLRITGKTNPSMYIGDNRPVEQVNWFDARDFCEARGARLPTEAEWEYAGRGPDNLIYPWGNTWNFNYAVTLRDQSTVPTESRSRGTQDVDYGTSRDGRSWVGAYHLSGNVWEWTGSLHMGYPYNPNSESEDFPQNSLGNFEVRGGGFVLADELFLRLATRTSALSTGTSHNTGFRCARDVD